MKNYLLLFLVCSFFSCQHQKKIEQRVGPKVKLSCFVSTTLDAAWKMQAIDFIEDGPETDQYLNIDFAHAAQELDTIPVCTLPTDTIFTKSDWNEAYALWLKYRQALASGQTSLILPTDEESALSKGEWYTLYHLFSFLKRGARYIPIEGTYINGMDIILPDAMAFENPDSTMVLIVANISKRWHAASIHFEGKTFTPELRDYSLNTLIFNINNNFINHEK